MKKYFGRDEIFYPVFVVAFFLLKLVLSNWSVGSCISLILHVSMDVFFCQFLDLCLHIFSRLSLCSIGPPKDFILLMPILHRAHLPKIYSTLIFFETDLLLPFILPVISLLWPRLWFLLLHFFL
jgi:hypothetical protein